MSRDFISKCVVYYDREWDNNPIGWYFWDETWSTPFGPYETREETIKQLELYIKTALNGEL